MSRAELATAIREVARLDGTFRLRSGQTATEYFDKYQFEARPELLAAVASHLLPLIPNDCEVLAGLELGGIPIATALSLASGLPLAFVRKVSKSYGTERLAEGFDVSNRRVVVIEDVITTGGQVVESVRALKARGALIDSAVCVIDRRQGAGSVLEDEDIRLSALFVRSDLE